jgi:uncharacterized membrane protein
VAVLVSVMVVPGLCWVDCTLCVVVGRHRFNPFDGAGSGFTPFFLANSIAWRRFILQTVFLSVLATVLVNLLPRRLGKLRYIRNGRGNDRGVLA